MGLVGMDWHRLDEYIFVKLVGDLLGRLGFVDIDLQGDGPDGGIDIFATELVPFAVQGRLPFRWAVQCKFSNEPEDKSVNDREVRDVEGLLRSERYTAQDLRGYMLVTNRQIVQNVVERLRGIDRRSQYRTARLDSGQLESMLVNHPELVRRYFIDVPGTTGLGRPVLIATPLATGFSNRRIAYLPIEVRVKDSSGVKCERAMGIVDTGADMTCVPRKLLEALDAQPTEKAQIVTPRGVRPVYTYVVDLGIERLVLANVIVVGIDFEHVLLGRDSLKGFTVVIDPGGAVALYEEPSS